MESGNSESAYKMSPEENADSVEDKGMRVLKLWSDSSWKFAQIGPK
jgi:hypothetical protein